MGTLPQVWIEIIIRIKAYCGPVVEQLGPVGGVVCGSEDVHHHEVLDVVFLSPLLQLVDVAAADALHLSDHGQVDLSFSVLSHFV